MAYSALNQVIREQQRLARANARLQDRLEKKIEKLDTKKEKILDALQEEYAKGKIDKNKYEGLLPRMDDIGLELLVFGNVPGITLAKRYVTGLIDKDEFHQFLSDIIPHEVQQERSQFSGLLDSFAQKISIFVNDCSDQPKKVCQHCKRKGLFKFVREMQGLMLCRRCRKKLDSFLTFEGINGRFLSIDPIQVSLENFSWIRPVIQVRGECVLNLS